MIFKLIVCWLSLWTLVSCQMEYWSPYGSPEAAGHYSGQVASGPGYPGSPLAGDISSYYPHHYGSPGRQYTSPLMARAFPPTPAFIAPSAPVRGCSADSPAKIDWGDCPSLESKEEDKKAKEEKQKECMKNLELNENTTFTQLTPVLQNRVRECTLRKDELVSVTLSLSLSVHLKWCKFLLNSHHLTSQINLMTPSPCKVFSLSHQLCLSHSS